LYLVEIMKIAVISLIVILSAISACAQTRTAFRLYRPCPGVGQQAKVEINRSGDVDLVPCSGRSLLLNGTPFSNGFTVSGAGRTNYVPFFSTETNLAKSPLSWNGTFFNFNNPTGDSLYTMEFNPSPTGYLRVGTTDENTRFFFDFFNKRLKGNFGAAWPYTTLDLNPNFASILTSQFNAGDVNGDGNFTYFNVDDFAKQFTFSGDGSAKVTYYGIGNFFFNRTITTGGCGGVTINKPAGTVNVCTGSTSVQVNNSTVTANSIVLPVARTYDPTCGVRAVVPDAGNFVIYMTASCTGDTSIGWLVLN
jgi:hypothetical protein